MLLGLQKIVTSNYIGSTKARTSGAEDEGLGREVLTLTMIGTFSMSQCLGRVKKLNMTRIDVGRYHDARPDLQRSESARRYPLSVLVLVSFPPSSLPSDIML